MKCQNLSDIELEKNSVNHKLASVTHEKEFIQVMYLPTMDCGSWYTGMDNPWLTFYKYSVTIECALFSGSNTLVLITLGIE